MGKQRNRPRRACPALLASALCSLALTPPAQAAPPTIANTGFSSVTTDSVLLEAEIDPQSKKTEYHFEYGLGDCTLDPCTSTPIPDGELPAGSSPEPVSAEVKGLTPGTTYHFRLIAESKGTGGGKTVGPDTTFATYHLPQVFGPCPNEAFRKGKPSARLPDCRAYEQASPTDKNGGDARGRVAFLKASTDGSRIGFVGTSPIPGAEGSQELPIYLASRDEGSWSTQGLMPPALSGDLAFVLGWTPDFSHVFDFARRFSGLGGSSMLSLGTADGSLITIVPYGSGLKDTTPPSYAGVSADGSQVFFESGEKLTTIPAAIEGKSNVYVWDEDTGTVSLAALFNDGTAPPEGAFAGPYDWIAGDADRLQRGGAAASYYTQDDHAISADGSLYFTAAKTGQLYLRVNSAEPQSSLDGEGKCTDLSLACTIHVSASQRAVPDPLGSRAAAFIGATPDGSKILFTSPEELTDDANTGPVVPPATIARANVDGSGKDLSFLPTDARGIVVDSTYVYWADPVQGTIGRAKLDGEEFDDDFITGAGKPQYVAVDDEYVYWTDAEDEGKEQGKIGRADLDGTDPDPDFITGATNPQGIDIDATYVYWSNGGNEDATRTIGRADIDGSPASVEQTFLPVGEGPQEFTPQGLAVNATHVYAGINGTQKFSYVFRFDIGGEPPNRKLFFDVGAQGVAAKGVALDSTYLYWARQGADSIGRTKLADFPSSAESEFEFIKEAGDPIGVAANATHLYWSANQGAPANPGNDLYRYDVDSGELTDLAPDPSATNGTEIVGVLGISDDASAVYFVANGDLDGIGPAQAGDCEGTVKDIFIDFNGQCSLYLAREGNPVESIARLDASGPAWQTDVLDWLPRGGVGAQEEKTARVSADGSTLLFRSQQKLTDYDNEGTAVFYRYRVGVGIGCVSCNPTGESPSEERSLGSATLSALVPPEWSYTLSRNLSADGNRVFFETTDALVAADTNGEGGCPIAGSSDGKYPICLDVYEWEAKGTGSCEEDMQGGGCFYLLSTGDSPDASFIADASTSGDDVFLLTRSQLVGQDQDQLYDVYDASVGGGLPSQYPSPQQICEGEGCRPATSPPPASESAGSASFSGPGNPKASKPKPRCPKSKRRVRSKGKTRCVAKQRRGDAKGSRRGNR